MEITGIGGVPPIPAVTGTQRTAATQFELPEQPSTDSIPADAWKAIEASTAVADRMASQNRDLHFSMEEDKLRIEMRDASGRVVRTVPNTDLMHLVSGKV